MHEYIDAYIHTKCADVHRYISTNIYTHTHLDYVSFASIADLFVAERTPHPIHQAHLLLQIQ